MVWRCACGLDLILQFIFCHFSTLLTLSFFASAISTSRKFDLYLVLSCAGSNGLLSINQIFAMVDFVIMQWNR